MTKRFSTIINRGYGSAILLLSFLSIIMVGCSDSVSDNANIYGKYKSYSEDPAINRYLINEDNYIQINKNNTIVYNTTINGKPKFNFNGTYSYDKGSNILTIKWNEGKIPDTLKIGEDHIIKIGETFYKRTTAD